MYEAYLITNDITGQQYVGVTRVGLETRFNQHYLDAVSEERGSKPSKLHVDMLKYGMEHFHMTLLQGDIPDEPSILHQKVERYYISKYRTYYLDENDGYNMTQGGNGTQGYIFTDDDRLKMSEIHKGKPLNLSPEEREARRVRMLSENRPFKQEWKDAIRNSRLGKYKGEENPFYGKHHTEQVKQGIRERNSGSPVLQFDSDYNLVQEFFNLMDAGRWVVEKELSKAHYSTCANRISEVCKNSNAKCTAYGYHWKFKEGQSTNCSLEDELLDEAQSTL